MMMGFLLELKRGLYGVKHVISSSHHLCFHSLSVCSKIRMNSLPFFGRCIPMPLLVKETPPAA